MLDVHNLLIFLAASGVLIVTPGPDMLYVLARGMSYGRIAGLISALGVITGTLVHTCAAAFGLATLFQASVVAFDVLKLAGAGYLVYLGVKTLRSADTVCLRPARARQLRRVFWQGVLSSVTNPKLAIFFLAFLPQFTQPNLGNTATQLFVLGLMFSALGLAMRGWAQCRMAWQGAHGSCPGGKCDSPAERHHVHWLGRPPSAEPADPSLAMRPLVPLTQPVMFTNKPSLSPVTGLSPLPTRPAARARNSVVG